MFPVLFMSGSSSLSDCLSFCAPQSDFIVQLDLLDPSDCSMIQKLSYSSISSFQLALCQLAAAEKSFKLRSTTIYLLVLLLDGGSFLVNLGFLSAIYSSYKISTSGVLGLSKKSLAFSTSFSGNWSPTSSQLIEDW